MDFLRHDLANVTVRIGTSTTQTDAEGRFTIAAVSAEYDLTVMLTYPADDHDTQVTWQWLGLTRRDPTLQVLKGAQPRLATTILYLDQIDFPLAPSQRTITVWTSPDCATSWDASAAAEGPIDLVFSGPSRTSGQARTLLYEVTGTPELPSAYSAYHEQPFTLTDGARELPFHADLSADMIATKTLSGVITGSSWNRKLSVYLRFPDDSAIRLLSDYRVSDSFSYLVPDLPSATFTVVVDDHQDDQNQGLVEAHAAGLAAGASNITLTLPERPTLDAPSPDESAVDGQTLFEWHGDARVYLLCAETDATHERVCVTTAKQRAKLPFGSPVTRAQYVWNVAQHDHYRSVDEAAGADGQLSAYVPGNGAVVGPKRGDGLLAISASRAFTTKP